MVIFQDSFVHFHDCWKNGMILGWTKNEREREDLAGISWGWAKDGGGPLSA